MSKRRFMNQAPGRITSLPMRLAVLDLRSGRHRAVRTQGAPSDFFWKIIQDQ